MNCEHTWEEIAIPYKAYNYPYARGEDAYSTKEYIFIRKCSKCQQVIFADTKQYSGDNITWISFETEIEAKQAKERKQAEQLAYRRTPEYAAEMAAVEEETKRIATEFMKVYNGCATQEEG